MKVCKREGCKYKVFSKGFCKSHWQQNFGKPIRKISDKLSNKLKDYSIERKDYLRDHPYCEAGVICRKRHIATDIHHKKGKIGDLLTDKRFFLAVCRLDHKWIEENPDEAKALGFSVSRLSKE